MDEFILGSEGIISVYEVDAWKPIGCLTTNSLSSALSIIETRTKCMPNVTIRRKGAFSYNLVAEGIYIDTTSVGGDTAKVSHDKLLIIQEGVGSLQWRLGTGLADTQFYYGTAVLTELEASFDGSDDNFAIFTLTLEGDGEILRADPNV